jgi:glycosyltransferase involved in cell wall biosynthesis
MRLLVAGATSKSLIRFRGPLLDALVQVGHEVHACAGEPDPATTESLSRRGVRFHPVFLERAGTNPLSDLRYGRELELVVRKLRPDLVLSYTLKPAIFGSLAARRHGLRSASMITGAGQALTGGGIASSLLSATVRGLLRTALATNEVVFFQNPDDLEEFVTRRIASRPRSVLLAGSGVDLEHFAPSPAPSGPLTFLLVARLLRDKGILDFAEAARALAGRGDLRFRLLGPREPGQRGLTASELEYCARAGLEYDGEVEDVRPFLRDCSVFVLPSYYREGQPRSILEALATGRAVVTTDAPGCRETVREGVNGFLVPPRRIDRLTQALSRFVDDGSLVARMGVESRKLAEATYDVHQVNRTILDALGLRSGIDAERASRAGVE